MYPKKSRELIPEYAAKVGVPEEDLEQILDFYYSELREKLRNLDYTRIQAEGLGTFRIRRAKLLKELESKCEKIINSGWTPTETRKLYKHVLERTIYIKGVIAEETERISKIKQLKKEYREDKANGIQWTKEQLAVRRLELFGDTRNRSRNMDNANKRAKKHKGE